MKRDIYQKLQTWKLSKRRKPLILKGARQTGKTFILKEFGKREFKKVHYFNFEETPEIGDFFSGNLEPINILNNLALYKKNNIEPDTDLIIFDEIQACENALTSLKYFAENAEAYYIIAAGSLLGLKISGKSGFPVGKVNLLNIYPMTFLEFIEAAGEAQYRKLIEEIEPSTNVPKVFHEKIINLLHQYYFVGGMPEAVKEFCETKNFEEVRKIHKEILKHISLILPNMQKQLTFQNSV